MKRYILAALAVVATILVASRGFSGGEKPPRDPGPTGALIVRVGVLSREGVGKVSAIRVVDPKMLSDLEAFFPDYRKRPSSDTAGGWMAGYHVYFDFPGGESTRVTVSENDKARYWSVGQGDFATKGDFARFVEGLDR